MSEGRLTPLHGLSALTNRELKKWYKEPVILLLSLVQPILWIGIFGKAMNFASMFKSASLEIPGLTVPKQIIDEIGSLVLKQTFGTTDYFSFLAVGMLSFIVLFTSMSSGMTIVWDRRLGFLGKLLTTPVPRGSIIVSKVIASIVKSLVQATIILLIGVLLGLRFAFGMFAPVAFIITYLSLFLLSFGFSSLFLMLALRSTRWETQMAIMNLLNLPLLFSSNSFYPISSMPWWLKPVALANPLTYANAVSRWALLGITPQVSVMLSMIYLVAFAVIFTALGITLSWRYLSL